MEVWKSAGCGSTEQALLNMEVLSKHCQACATHHEMNTSFMKFWIGGKVTRLHVR